MKTLQLNRNYPQAWAHPGFSTDIRRFRPLIVVDRIGFRHPGLFKNYQLGVASDSWDRNSSSDSWERNSYLPSPRPK